ncbi:MAG: hypothetical protein WC518_01050 [Patescibacteria group bacterium]
MKKLLFGLVLASAMALAAGGVGAQVFKGTNTNLNANINGNININAGAKAQAVKGAIALCANIESRVKMKIANYEAGKVRHANAYNNLKSRLAALNDKLVAKGADTTKLQSDLLQLDSKVAKFLADYDTYINKLREGQAFVCGKSQGQFLAKMKEARAALKVVWQDAKEIKDYYVKTIRPDLQAIREQLKKQQAAAAASADINAEAVNGQVNSETTQEGNGDAENINQ